MRNRNTHRGVPSVNTMAFVSDRHGAVLSHGETEMRTTKEVNHEVLTATLIVFLCLLLWPDNAALGGRHGGSRSEAPHNVCLSPTAKTGRYPSGFL